MRMEKMNKYYESSKELVDSFINLTNKIMKRLRLLMLMLLMIGGMSVI